MTCSTSFIQSASFVYIVLCWTYEEKGDRVIDSKAYRQIGKVRNTNKGKQKTTEEIYRTATMMEDIGVRTYNGFLRRLESGQIRKGE